MPSDPANAGLPGGAFAAADKPPPSEVLPPALAERLESEPSGDQPSDEDGIKRDCPWPPDPATWRVLDERCLAVLNRTRLDPDWRRVLDDPLGTKQAVVAAFDNPECRVPEGETRPDLYEACAAEAMVRLAELQRKCLRELHMDWDDIYSPARPTAPERRAANVTQEEFYRIVEDISVGAAHNLWRVYMCRSVPPEAFDWVEALPEPPAGTVGLVTIIPDQSKDLYVSASRLGATVPDWVLSERHPQRAVVTATGETFSLEGFESMEEVTQYLRERLADPAQD